MVRLSKPERDRHVSYKRPKTPGKKTGSKACPKKVHVNALCGDCAATCFIPKIS